ncbi:TonB-dependent receptor [Perlabentimonas gracilis]|uniref:TonB-dependent receptor n=1 Tax=Perlabentimonas gracilis TaxID=2715279 RepID=UPI00140A1664|nr:TonB-dependent receptor [Perlabentimonas gracilis]NHB69457.1 TonB-dependent receptor [Perlabentimonas gracilis]
MTRKFLMLLAIAISLLGLKAQAQNRFTISGYVYEKGSRETMPGVNIYIPETTLGTASNSYGFYSLTLPAGEYEVVFSFVGYQPRSFSIKLNQNVPLNVEIDPSIEIEGVEVRAEMPKQSSRSSQMSVMEIPIRQIKSIPALLGEKDALKVVQLMPGVQKGSEGTSGLYVRGGGPDQNLIILDDATVYNAYHLFGFFSLFNGDAIKSLELTKGGFPARYGGRLSSVLEIVMKDGNKEKISGEAGIGMLSSRLVLEGPIVKDKASFLVSGRRTYYDVLARPFIPKDIKLGLYFYDLTAKANWEINNNNRIFLSGYFGEDKFSGGEEYEGAKYEGGMFWNNATSTIRWNHIFTSRLFSNLSVIFSNYRLNIYARDEYEGDVFELSYRSGIRDFGAKYDFTWMPRHSHTIRFGMTSTWHSFNPSAVVIRDDYLNEFESIVNTIDTYESGLYLEDEVKILDKGIVNAGVRLSHHYHDGASNFSFEPRISGSYYLTNTLSAKASYAQMNQYIHLLTSTGIGLPTDLWVPATKDAPAQDSWQVAAGFAKDLKDISTTISLEGYYKESDNVITYREGASFLMFDDPTNANNIKWEDNITSGFGWSYGVEFLAHKKMGRFSGWVGYTLSWTQLQFDEINMGKPYWARYDRRHDISVVGVYEFSPGVTLSGIWVYGTGNAVTLPLATYPVNQHVPNSVSNYVWTETIQDYGKKNDFRMAPYHRLDVSVQIHKKFEKYERTWEFGAYNAYNRQNPFMYFVRGEERHNPRTGESTYVNKLKQISLFQFIPSVSWSIKF